jgi:hypothetical protein
MEILIGLILFVAVGYLLYVNNSKKPLDVNKDGKVDTQDLVSVAPVLTQTITKAADVNNDGKVDAADVVEVVAKTKRKAKETAVKVKTAAKKAVKPKTKK